MLAVLIALVIHTVLSGIPKEGELANGSRHPIILDSVGRPPFKLAESSHASEYVAPPLIGATDFPSSHSEDPVLSQLLTYVTQGVLPVNILAFGMFVCLVVCVSATPMLLFLESEVVSRVKSGRRLVTK